MRVSSQFFRSYATGPSGSPGDPPKGEAGSDGRSWLGDYMGGGPDVNPELTGQAKFDMYDEMAATDASVKGLMMFLLLPCRSAAWGLNPKTDEPEAKLIRDAAAWQFGLEEELGQLDLSWDELMQQGLGQIMRMGPCIEELVWDDMATWRDADGDPHLLRPLARVALRPARTISKVEWEKGRIRRVEQGYATSSKTVDNKSGFKVSYMVFERRDGYWDGVSLLRPAWGPWTLKKALMVSSGIGWDRFAFGILKIHHPDTPEAADEATEIGRNVQAHERGYVRFPVEVGAGYQDSDWNMEIENAGATLADPVPLLRFYTEQIYEAGMEQFSRQGFGQTGARATSETQVDPFFLAVQAMAHYYRRERLRQVIRPWVRVNFGAEAEERWTPELTVSKIQARNIEVISRAIALLEPAGYQLTEREDQDDVRELLGFGRLKEAAAKMGVSRDQVEAALAAGGLTPETLQLVLAKLPADLGVKLNRREGNGLPLPA